MSLTNQEESSTKEVAFRKSKRIKKNHCHSNRHSQNQKVVNNLDKYQMQQKQKLNQ